MDRDRYILKPLPDPDGKRGFRIEIDELIADNRAMNLMILALQYLQKDNMKEIDMKNNDSTEITSEPDWMNYYSLGSSFALYLTFIPVLMITRYPLASTRGLGWRTER